MQSEAVPAGLSQKLPAVRRFVLQAEALLCLVRNGVNDRVP